MAERQWAIWGGVAGALLGVALTGAAGLVFDGDLRAGVLLFAIVAGVPALIGLGAVIALDAGALLCSPRGEGHLAAGPLSKASSPLHFLEHQDRSRAPGCPCRSSSICTAPSPRPGTA